MCGLQFGLRIPTLEMLTDCSGVDVGAVALGVGDTVKYCRHSILGMHGMPGFIMCAKV